MKINEIFYSLQGEGYYTGVPAVFVRFAGCNLRCPFCDTDFNDYTEMTEAEIVEEILKYKCPIVILTGGEPTIQITDDFIHLLHLNSLYVCIETNGTRHVPENINWVTVSPKHLYTKSNYILKEANEVKVVMDDKIQDSEFNTLLDQIKARYYYIQPCDTGRKKLNKKIIERCVNFVKDNPKWRLSLQTQKILDIR